MRTRVHDLDAARGRSTLTLGADLSKRIALLLLLCAGVGTSCARELPDVNDGDVIFQTSRSSQSVAVQRATHSRFSHMGIVIIRSGRPYVLEASVTVRYTPLRDWIDRGVSHAFVVKRLATALNSAQVASLRATAQGFVGRPYDLTFEWSDARMYCSELVWKIYDRALEVKLGALQRLSDFDLSDAVVKGKLHERYGDHIPLDEPVISPAVIFGSSLLVTSATSGS